jgi:replication fork protection complex subunit Csm3/Swi3
MVEKAGHKKRMVIARNQWIKEGEPKSGNGDDELEETGDLPETATGHAQAAALPARPATPPRNQDVPDDDDIYGVTPIAQRRPRTVANFDEPDEDDLEALMAEAEGQDAPPPPQVVGPDDDELEALMAEAENETASNTATSANNAPKPPVNEYADEEAAMAEMEGLW